MGIIITPIQQRKELRLKGVKIFSTTVFSGRDRKQTKFLGPGMVFVFTSLGGGRWRNITFLDRRDFSRVSRTRDLYSFFFFFFQRDGVLLCGPGWPLTLGLKKSSCFSHPSGWDYKCVPPWLICYIWGFSTSSVDLIYHKNGEIINLLISMYASLCLSVYIFPNQGRPLRFGRGS